MTSYPSLCDLGLHFDQKLTLAQHIDLVLTAFSATLLNFTLSDFNAAVTLIPAFMLRSLDCSSSIYAGLPWVPIW